MIGALNMKERVMTELLAEIREMYNESEIALHRPVFEGAEVEELTKCVESNYVSSVGSGVTTFESKLATIVGARYAVATSSGTTALHLALLAAGVSNGDEVLTQSLSFVATSNAISYIGARPVFLDVDKDTMSLSPVALREFLETHAVKSPKGLINKLTNKRISACVPMHTFGLMGRILEIRDICDAFGIPLVEDAAEALGSGVKGQPAGSLGQVGIFSFNGNKIVTTGGGGAVVTDCQELAGKVRHLATTGKLSHPFEFIHDTLAYNYRMPNLNASLGLAQLSVLPRILESKRYVSSRYEAFFQREEIKFNESIAGTNTNFWLNSIVVESRNDRDLLLNRAIESGIAMRPLWRPLHMLPMYSADCRSDLTNTIFLYDRVVALPSSAINGSVKNGAIRGN